MDTSKVFDVDHKDSDVASIIKDKDEIPNNLGELKD